MKWMSEYKIQRVTSRKDMLSGFEREREREGGAENQYGRMHELMRVIRFTLDKEANVAESTESCVRQTRKKKC